VEGQNGGVPYNVIGPLDQLSEAVAGLAGMSTGGGGLYNEATPKQDPIVSIPNFQGGGGGGTGSSGSNGNDSSASTPGVTDHGRGGRQVGTTTGGFFEDGILGSGGAGGGGGAGDDDGGGSGILEDGIVDLRDDGGGGGGGGGGFVGIACRGDMTLGSIDIMDPLDPLDDVAHAAFFRCVGGRGGSTYDDAFISGSPPAPDSIDGDQGQGEAGGGGGGGGISIIAGDTMSVNALEAYAYGKAGGNSPNIEGGNRAGVDQGGSGGGGKIYMADSNGFGLGEVIGNLQVFLQPDPTRPGLTPEQQQDFAEMSGTVWISFGVWGDEPREAMFGATQIVTECFDTLSDSTSYDGALILWNAPRFPYSGGSPSLRTMRIFVDTVKAGPGGLPDIATVEAPDGTFALDPAIGFTQEVPVADALVPAAYQMQQVLPAGAGSLGKRFVRLRIRFDPTLISTDPNVLLGPPPLGFAPPGGAPLPIADDPATPGLENTRGNLDTAPQGVPAIAEVRVTFTP
jgi:hypothetical protein